MPFMNRTQAGRQLAAALAKYRDEYPIILALPRGGVPVAAEIAKALKAPLDLLLVRKIGVPFQTELAMGAVVDGGSPVVVRNEDIIRAAAIGEADFKVLCENALREIERRRARYVGNRRPLDVAGRTVIVVDDGIATGATMRAALRATRMRGPKRLVLAVPVAPPETLAHLRHEVDDMICLDAPEIFDALGFYFRDFHQLSDEEVVSVLDGLRFPKRPAID